MCNTRWTFGTFMHAWLYGELHTPKGTLHGGYYNDARVGKSLDFYTNVSVGRFFGYCVAYYLNAVLEKYALQGRIALVEIGSEKGDLIADVAEFWQYFCAQKVEFVIVEPFLNLQTLQKATWKQRNLKAKLQCVQDFSQLKALDFDCVLYFSNELLDAFAVELLFENKMAFVEFRDNAQSPFALVFEDAKAWMLEMGISIGEIPLRAEAFVKHLANVACKWLFLTFDYGDVQPRNAFSLRLYSKHKTQNVFKESLECQVELFKYFGQVDITYDVNFSLWEKLFCANGAVTLFLQRQNRALVDMGLDKMCALVIQKFGLESYMQQSAKLRALIAPGMFGERFFGFCVGNLWR